MSAGLTAALFALGFPFFFLVLIVPLIPFLRRREGLRRCPVCGYESFSDRFCPRDGSPLAPDSKSGEGKERER